MSPTDTNIIGNRSIVSHLSAPRPRGEWESFDIVFQAPRFAAGDRVAKARFLRVVHNGTLIHENVDMDGVYKGALDPREMPFGPTVLQGAVEQVAFRNLRIKPLNLSMDFFNGKDLAGWDGDPNIWNVKDGKILGKADPGTLKQATFLISRKRYRDFQLSFQAKFEGENRNGGLQIRSDVADPKSFVVKGPQVDLGWACAIAHWSCQIVCNVSCVPSRSGAIRSPRMVKILPSTSG